MEVTWGYNFLSVDWNRHISKCFIVIIVHFVIVWIINIFIYKKLYAIKFLVVFVYQFFKVSWALTESFGALQLFIPGLSVAGAVEYLNWWRPIGEIPGELLTRRNHQDAMLYALSLWWMILLYLFDCLERSFHGPIKWCCDIWTTVRPPDREPIRDIRSLRRPIFVCPSVGLISFLETNFRANISQVGALLWCLGGRFSRSFGIMSGTYYFHL